MWLEKLECNEEMIRLFGDTPPKLDNVVIYELKIDCHNREVNIGISFNDFPNPLPKGWENLSCCEMNLELTLTGYNFMYQNLNGLVNPCGCSLSILEQPDHSFIIKGNNRLEKSLFVIIVQKIKVSRFEYIDHRLD